MSGRELLAVSGVPTPSMYTCTGLDTVGVSGSKAQPFTAIVPSLAIVTASTAPIGALRLERLRPVEVLNWFWSTHPLIPGIVAQSVYCQRLQLLPHAPIGAGEDTP